MDLLGWSIVVYLAHLEGLTMNVLSKWAGLLAAILFAAAAGSYAIRAQGLANPPQNSSAEQSRVTLSQTLPQLDGRKLKATVVEVTYAPGGSSTPHSHPCPVIVYVVEGALREQVKGEPEAVYQAGDSFYEPPNGVHQVSANASQTEPVRFLAYFVCDHETPLSVPPPDSKLAGGKQQ
jgi:quercetin dioxygenase-like cupin family protein